MFLLDTDVLLELRKPRGAAMDQGVQRWAETADVRDLHLSVQAIADIELAIAAIALDDERAAIDLTRWLRDKVLVAFADRILPITVPVSKAFAQVAMNSARSDRDAWLAALSIVHNLTLVSGNKYGFIGNNVIVLDPWSSASAGS